MKKSLGEQLKIYRNRQFPDQGLRKVAEQIDFNFTHLNRIERGLPPSSETIYKLAEAYKLDEKEKFELLQLANIAHQDPKVISFFDQNPEKLKEIYFRKEKLKPIFNKNEIISKQSANRKPST